MNSTQEKISLVIPIFNEKENIEPLHKALQTVYSKLPNSEVIFVNDGSSDGSLEELKKITAHDQKIKIISFRKNYGQTAAMSAGIEYASGTVIVPLDGDLQNDPNDIPMLIAKLDEGFDVVSGWRKNRHDGGLRVWLSHIANRIICRITGVYLHDYGCTLKAYRSDVVKDIDFLGEIHRLIPVYASWYGAKVTEMVVTHHPRTRGKSKYGFSRIFKVILDLLVAKFFLDYSSKPIYFFGVLSFVSFIFGFLSFVGAVIFRIYGTSFIQTPLLLFTVMAFVVGLQLLSMGLLADMILRTRQKKNALYSIKEKIGF